MNNIFFLIFILKVLLVRLLSVQELLRNERENFMDINDLEDYEFSKNKLFKSGNNVSF